MGTGVSFHSDESWPSD